MVPRAAEFCATVNFTGTSVYERDGSRGAYRSCVTAKADVTTFWVGGVLVCGGPPGCDETLL